MKVLSLFDGMACGMLAMQRAGIEVDRYVAYEIDKYAVQTASCNFPMIEQRGDVFKADFTEFAGFDFLIGGSPCTYWSIAQTNTRETEASGMGWELFSQYVRALHEANPKFFVYENNKSMSKAIRASIDAAFGFEAVCINSDLVSAQMRQRLYWVGKRNEDGTYSKVPVEQPKDLGILLKDVLECGYALKEKQGTIDANYFKGGNYSSPKKQSGQRMAVAEPVFKELSEREMDYMVRDSKGKYSDRWAYLQKPGENDKALCITANVSKGVPYNICADPVHGFATVSECDEDGKPVKATSWADGKIYTVYEVKDGFITIKGKQYPIKLADGVYIIRKLTVRECMRLQTVPEWYEFPVSDSQAYKMLGNGWTVDVIAHILQHIPIESKPDYTGLVTRLRSTLSVSKRKMLDEAADAIEHLLKEVMA